MQVRDLLSPKRSGDLKVREHPVLGPYVQDLVKIIVHKFEDVDRLMAEGNRARTVASTAMNAESSRSHAVFSLLLTQTETVPNTDLSSDKVTYAVCHLRQGFACHI